MKNITIFFIISTLFSLNVKSKSLTLAGSFDPRMQSAVFNKKDVINVNLTDGYVSSIIFNDDERILDIVCGFSAGYEIKDSSNILYIKPIFITSNDEDKNKLMPDNRWNTNLLITTTKNIYVFDLNIVHKNSIGLSYQIYLKYYDEKKVLNESELALIKEKEKISAEEERKKILLKIEDVRKKNLIDKSLNEFKSPLNWNYHFNANKNAESITPIFAYDDGQFTYLGFDKTKSFPAVYLYENKKESIVNTHVKYDGNFQVLVIQKLSKSFVLRSGDKVVGIYNKSFGVNIGGAKNNTTSSSKVKRVIKNEQK